MKIVQVLLSKRIGGAETLAASLESEWSAVGVASEIVYLDEDGSSSHPLSRMRRLVKTLHYLKPDVVVAHSALPAVYARVCAPIGARIYSVLHSASDDFEDRKLNAAERALRWRTHGVIAVSAPQAWVYRSRFGDSVPIHVIPNGISREFRRQREEATRPAMIIEVARVVAQKRPDVWLTAIAEVLDTHPQMDAAWWGPPSGDTRFDEEVAATASHAGLSHVFKGATSAPESAYAQGDILAHAATREAHSVGLLEAAAMGLTVVCSDSVARDLPSNFPAVTFRDGDTRDLAIRLAEVIADWEPHSRRAHAYAAEIAATYSAEECARRYLRILDGGRLTEGEMNGDGDHADALG